MADGGFRFKKAYVEVTPVCNLRCDFCPPTRRPGVFLTPERFGRVVDQVAPVTRHLHLHVKGEPLLHPDLPLLLDRAGSAGLRVHLVTNGTLLAPRADLLLGHPAVHRVNVSLHSFVPDPREPEARAAARTYLAPVADFARRAEAGGRLLTVLRFWDGRSGDRAGDVLLGVLDEVLPRDGRRLGARTFLDFGEPFVWPSLDGPERSDRGFCLGLRDQFGVLADGTVVPCCLDGEGAVSLGNLFEADLADILAGPRARALYDGFTERRCAEPLCRRCGFRERFDRPDRLTDEGMTASMGIDKE